MIRYIKVAAPSASAPLLPYTDALAITLTSAPNKTPRLAKPVAPLVAYKLRLAKYVKQSIHSTRTPFFIVIASTPGVIKVTALNNMLALLLAEFATLPSTNAPLPASPALKPLGSPAEVADPCVITLTFCT